MTGTTAQQTSGDDGTELPRPGGRSRWRWSRPGHALVAGGALAAVLSLAGATATATGAGAATTTWGSGNTGTAAHGRPQGGLTRPTVSGKITALSGDDITVTTDGKTSVIVVYSSSTKFESNPGPNGGATSSASALKVGDYIGVTGTKNSDGTVAASSVMTGRPPQTGKGGPGRGGKPPTGAGRGAPTA